MNLMNPSTRLPKPCAVGKACPFLLLREGGVKIREASPLFGSHKFEYFCIIGQKV